MTKRMVLMRNGGDGLPVRDDEPERQAPPAERGDTAEERTPLLDVERERPERTERPEEGPERQAVTD